MGLFFWCVCGVSSIGFDGYVFGLCEFDILVSDFDFDLFEILVVIGEFVWEELSGCFFVVVGGFFEICVIDDVVGVCLFEYCWNDGFWQEVLVEEVLQILLFVSEDLKFEVWV